MKYCPKFSLRNGIYYHCYDILLINIRETFQFMHTWYKWNLCNSSLIFLYVEKDGIFEQLYAAVYSQFVPTHAAQILLKPFIVCHKFFLSLNQTSALKGRVVVSIGYSTLLLTILQLIHERKVMIKKSPNNSQ